MITARSGSSVMRPGTDGNPRQVGVGYRLELESLRGRGHARERLADRHRRALGAGLVEADWIDAGHHVVTQIRRLEAAGLQAGDDPFYFGVDRLQAGRVAFALAQAGRQRPGAEAVDLLEQ